MKPKCIPCKKEFASQSGLTRHLGSKGHEKVENAPLLAIFSVLIVSIINSYIRKYRHNCWECHFHNNRKDIYKGHLKSEEHCKKFKLKINKKYKCPDTNCGASFNSKQNLDRHLRSVTHNMSVDEKKQFNVDNGKQAAINGFNSETYIYILLSKLTIMNFVKCVGYNGNIYDIKYQLKGEKCIRFLQIKTISWSFGQNRFTMRTKGSNCYKNNTLIIGVDNKRKLFCLLLINDTITVEKIGFYPNSKNETKYSKYFYLDHKKFESDLIINLKKSIILSSEIDGLTTEQQTEFYSLQRLEIKGNSNDISYRPNLTNMSVIDCFLNDFNVQHKSSSRHDFHLHKIKGDNRKSSYSENDNIHLFVFEIVNEDNINNFFIIPTEIMIENGYIETNNKKYLGKISIKLPFKKNGKWSRPKHWSLKYLNNFDYFKNNMIITL
jgi:hypothetical protein